MEVECKKSSYEQTICEPVKHDHLARICMFQVKDKYYIVFDPGYGHGNIHIYECVRTIPVSEIVNELKKKYPHVEPEKFDREDLVTYYIRETFRVSNISKYDLCRCSSTR